MSPAQLRALEEFVRKHPSYSQKAIGEALGHHQATVQRALAQLGYFKSGRQWRPPADLPVAGALTRLKQRNRVPKAAVQALVLSAEFVAGVVLVRTTSGSAQAVGAYLAAQNIPWIAGTVAGHDTIAIYIRGNAEEIQHHHLRDLSRLLLEPSGE